MAADVSLFTADGMHNHTKLCISLK